MVELQAARADVVSALLRLRSAAGRRRTLTLRLSFRDGTLTLALTGAEISIPAIGEWPGVARMPWVLLAGLGRNLPDGDPLRLAVEDGRFKLGSYSVPAQWEDISPAPLATPLDMPAMLVLRLAMRHSDARMATSGLGAQLEQARDELDRRILAAHGSLHEYGVTKEDLATLVEECLRRQPLGG